MSADNYGIIHKTKDGYGISMFFASDDSEQDLSRPYFFHSSLRETVKVADQEYFEYGWRFDSEISDTILDKLEPED